MTIVNLHKPSESEKPVRLSSLPVGVYRATIWEGKSKVIIYTTRVVDQHIVFSEDNTVPMIVPGHYTVVNPCKVTIQSITTVDI